MRIVSLAVLWEPGTASALDSRVVAEGRDVGTAGTFSREEERFDRAWMIARRIAAEQGITDQDIAAEIEEAR